MLENNKIKSVFDYLHIIKSVSYEVYWIGFGALIFFSGEALILYFKEPHFLVPQIFFCTAIGFSPIVYKAYHLQFDKVTENINILFEIKTDIWDSWIFREEKTVFSLNHRFSKLIVYSLLFFVFYTMVFLPMPFKALPLVIFSYCAIFILTLFVGLIIQFTIMLLLLLRKLTFFKTVARFYLFPHPELTKLLRYYSSLSILVSVGYIALVFSVWFGPYGFNTQMLLWLSVLALYPLTLFIWSYFHIHLIQHNIKFSFIALINEQVNDSLMVTLKETDSSNIDRLDRFMTIQSKLHALKEYPFELSGFLTFFATFVITIIQIIIAVQKH